MINIESLRKTYNKGSRNAVTAVNNISLSLPNTGMVAFFGRSGCGKTTLLNLIGGLDKADSGSVSIGDAKIGPFEDEARNKNIGFIFQNYYLVETLTVEENVAASLRLCGLTDEEEISRRTQVALKAVGLERFRKRLPQNLSGGQQQRVAIARAIVKRPGIILADEPTGNLDEENTVMIMDLLKEISKTTLVVLVTHEHNLVNFYCDRVIEMLDGRTVGEFLNDTSDGYRAQGKNDVYLGDMQKEEEGGEKVSVSLYSDFPNEKLSISIINIGGVYYLRSDTPGANFRILDKSAEISVHEGTYEENVAQNKEQKLEQLADVLALPQANGKKVGRMYKARSAAKTAVKRHFTKKKRLRAALVVTMFMMSVIFVIMIANSLSVLNVLDDVKSNFDAKLMYVPMQDIDESELSAIREESNIVYPSAPFSRNTYSFLAIFRGGYSSSSGYYHDLRGAMYANATVMPQKLLEGASLLCGDIKIISNDEAVITSTTAEDILKSSNLSFIKKEEDLLNLSLSFNFSGGTATYRIIGIISDPEREVYLSDLAFAQTISSNSAAAPQSVQLPGEKIEKGTVYVASDVGGNFKIGSKITVNGVSFTVSGYFDRGFSVDDKYYKEEIYISDKSVSVDSYYSGEVCVVMNDEDYMENAYHSGYSTFENMGYYYDRNYYAIYPKDHNDMKELLVSCGVSESEIDDEDKMFDYFYEYLYVEETVISYLVALVVISVFIALCMFFIMRSSITADVKEIGIYRAVGVSRRNIIFKYFVESNVIFFLTTFIGFALTSGVIVWANASSPLTHSLIYMPWYTVIATGLFLYALSVVCGILPVSLLTKKTPSAIISKYDI